LSTDVTEPLQVLVADDHPLFRDGLRTLLASAPDAELVGEATTGEEAVSLAAKLQPDVILMDVQMPGMGGIEATRRIVRDSAQVRVLVVTMFDDDGTVFQAMRAGARGYVLKGANYDEMLRAIRAVGTGEAIFSPKIAVRLMDFFSSIRPATLRNHVSNILHKLQVADRTEAIIRAREAGLGQDKA
jgi:DNA-binding NarL/FixJ family response regulator